MDDGYSIDYNAVRSSEIYTIVLGVITFIGPASVVFILILKRHVLLKDRPLTLIVLMIAISDTFASFATMLGFPTGKLCYAQGIVHYNHNYYHNHHYHYHNHQGFIIFFFARASWLYTVSLVFQLFCIIYYKKYFFNDKYIPMIVWPINVCLQFLPFSTRTQFGPQLSDDQMIPIGRCLLTPGNDNFSDYHLWLNVVFRNVLLASFCIIFVLAAFIIFYCRFHMDQKDPLQSLVNLVLMYEAALFVSWVPAAVFGEWRDRFYEKEGHYPANSTIISNYFEATVCIYGLLLSIIFYIKTERARKEWYNLIFRVDDDDMRSTASSDTSKNADSIVTTTINPIDDSIIRIGEDQL